MTCLSLKPLLRRRFQIIPKFEVSSDLALTQINNMMEATAASCDIDQAQLDIMMAAHDVETNRIKNMQKSAEQITGSV